VVGDHSDADSDVVVAVAGRRRQADLSSSSGVQHQQQQQQQVQKQQDQQQRHRGVYVAAAESAGDDSLVPGLDVLASAAAAGSSSWQSGFQQQQQQYGQQGGHLAEEGGHGSGSDQFTDAEEASALSEQMHGAFSVAEMVGADEMGHSQQQQQQPVGLSALQGLSSLGQLPLARNRAAAAAAAEGEVGSDEQPWYEYDGGYHSYSPGAGSTPDSRVGSPVARGVLGEGYRSFGEWELQQAWDSAEQGQHSGGIPRMQPGFMGHLEDVQLFCVQHLWERKQQRKQGGQQAGEQQQQQQQVLSAADVQAYQPSLQLREKLGPQTQLETVVAWLDLLCAAASGSSIVRGRVVRWAGVCQQRVVDTPQLLEC
jgi:hypothetical protein